MKLRFNNKERLITVLDDSNSYLAEYSLGGGDNDASMFIKCDRSFDAVWTETRIGFDSKKQMHVVGGNYMSDGEEYYLFEDVIVEEWFMILNLDKHKTKMNK